MRFGQRISWGICSIRKTPLGFYQCTWGCQGERDAGCISRANAGIYLCDNHGTICEHNESLIVTVDGACYSDHRSAVVMIAAREFFSFI